VVKLEVLTNCVVRRMLRKIASHGKDEDKKLIAINPYIQTVDQLIQSDKEALVEYISQWKESLGRQDRSKSRQYNKREVHLLLSNSELVAKIYRAYIEGILNCPYRSVRRKVLNLSQWPSDGDTALRQILLTEDLLGTDAGRSSEAVAIRCRPMDDS
jgi:hypothetical protein